MKNKTKVTDRRTRYTRQIIKDSFLDLLKEKKILIVHGGGFNWGQPDHFRIVYLPRIEVLREAMEKLGDFLSYYHQ